MVFIPGRKKSSVPDFEDPFFVPDCIESSGAFDGSGPRLPRNGVECSCKPAGDNMSVLPIGRKQAFQVVRVPPKTDILFSVCRVEHSDTVKAEPVIHDAPAGTEILKFGQCCFPDNFGGDTLRNIRLDSAVYVRIDRMDRPYVGDAQFLALPVQDIVFCLSGEWKKQQSKE